MLRTHKGPALWEPQPGPQEALLCLSTDITEVFYGGARGGGKTDGCLGEWIEHARQYGPHARGIFVRRIAEDLVDVILRSHSLFPKLGAKWNGVARTWTWPSGAVLRFRHMKDVQAASHYQGHAYTRIYFEELGQWALPDAYEMMRGALRSAFGVPCKRIGTGNPGGPGHLWLKARFYDPAPRGMTAIRDDRTGELRVFIPAKLEDNQVLMQADPTYEHRLLGAGPDALVRAWRYGDWEIIAGAYFGGVWNPRRQRLRPFPVPASWTLRRSFDWGSAVPSSFGIWAISDGTPIKSGVYENRIFPRGSAIRIGEWYTVQTDAAGIVQPNKGLRLSNPQLGRGIAKLSLRQGRPFSGCVADTSIFAEDGGPSIYAQMREGAKELDHNLTFAPADKRRVPGWQQMFQLLQASAAEGPTERPGMWYTETCRQFERTIPFLQMDPKNLEDVDKAGEDHPGDETRYLSMSLKRGHEVTSEDLV